MREPWTIKDCFGTTNGYMRILYNGEPAADVFPFAKDRDPEVMRKRAYRMVDLLNLAEQK